MKVFFDLDETLVHTVNYDPLDPSYQINSSTRSGTTYWTKLREGAREAIEISRSVVGPENVWILTAAGIDYAARVNEMFDLEFSPNQILAEDDIAAFTVKIAYGGSYTSKHPFIGDGPHFLIDNLKPRYNLRKIQLLGLNSSKGDYLHVPDYVGIENCDFASLVEDFLEYNINPVLS